MDDDLKQKIAPGESIQDAVDSLKRLVRRAELRALVARRRHARLRTEQTEEIWYRAAQEFYYAAALSKDFRNAVERASEAVDGERTPKEGMN